MATYLQIYNFRNDVTSNANFRARVTTAVATAAMAVLNESTGTTNHANRLIWAQDALRNTATRVEEMLWGVCGDATFQAANGSVTDAQLQTTVNGLVDTFAK